MTSLFERKLIVVTGKGGTGKSTVACAFGMIAARRGLRTIVVEVGAQRQIADLFVADRPPAEHPEHAEHAGHRRRHHDGQVELQESLWSMSLDPDRAMIDWLQTLTGRISARLLASSSTFHYFAAAAPGAKELVSMIEVRRLCEGPRTHRGSESYDLVVLDAPATGHALAMLSSPRTFTAIVRAGPLAEQARAVRELLEDPRRSAYVAVAQGTEMAVSETLELEQELRRRLDRDLDAVLVNGTVPRRFTREELARIARLDGDSASAGADDRVARGRATERTPPNERPEPNEGSPDTRVVRSATRTARAVHERARLQQSQIARLRRRRLADGRAPGVITIPFAFTPRLGLAGVREIAQLLQRKL